MRKTPLSVAELIALLQKCDQSAIILRRGYEHGYDVASTVKPMKAQKLENPDSWAGEFDSFPSDYEPDTVYNTVLIN